MRMGVQHAAEQRRMARTFNIIKGLDWAVERGARVINMSFAGPADPRVCATRWRVVQEGRRAGGGRQAMPARSRRRFIRPPIPT